MPAFTRADLQQAAVTYFARLVDELDQRSLSIENFKDEASWNVKCSLSRIAELDAQLRANTFDRGTQQRATDLANAGGWVLDDLTEREQLIACNLAARAEREQMLLLMHVISKPHLQHVPEDSLFESCVGTVPAGHQVEVSSGQMVLRQAVTEYLDRQKIRNVGQSHIDELSRALMWLRERIGDTTPLASVATAKLRTFRDDLARLDVTLRGKSVPFDTRLTNIAGRQIRSATAMRYWRSVQSFFAWCSAEQLLGTDPAVGLKLDRKKGEPKRTPPPFTAAELAKLFQTPLYAGYQSPKRVMVAGGCHKRERHWWSGVLLMFTGLRAGELSQLLPHDFVFDDDVPHLKVRKENERGERIKTTKNEASVRDVPLASQLLALGLREFVDQRSKIRPNDRVFGEFRLGTRDRKSDGLTKFWASYLRKFNLWKEGRSTHVWRHTVVACLRGNDVAQEDIGAFVGHSTGTITGGYGGDYPLSRKFRTAEKLDYGFDVVCTLGGAFDAKLHE